jgi:hypothetical protein
MEGVRLLAIPAVLFLAASWRSGLEFVPTTMFSCEAVVFSLGEGEHD